MKRRQGLWATLACTAALLSAPALAQPLPPAPRVGEMKALGNDRYQIGKIVIDKAARSFTVPGRVNLLDRPLEYLATSPGGLKSYETLFELDSSGSEFNLACILIGLENDPKQVIARRKTTPGPLLGPRVQLSVAWTLQGQRHVVSAAQAVLNPQAGIAPETVEWVYVGSWEPAELNGQLAADFTGTLIGFVPNDGNIIESSVGIGIGAYGSVRGNAVVPPKGTAIELIVQASSPAK
jgi:hypothetical protein